MINHLIILISFNQQQQQSKISHNYLSSSHLTHSNDWTEFTITNDDKTLLSVDKTTGMTTIESLTVTNELQGAVIESLKARIAALEVIHLIEFENCYYFLMF
jgi:hypothetical protein